MYPTAVRVISTTLPVNASSVDGPSSIAFAETMTHSAHADGTAKSDVTTITDETLMDRKAMRASLAWGRCGETVIVTLRGAEIRRDKGQVPRAITSA